MLCQVRHFAGAHSINFKQITEAKAPLLTAFVIVFVFAVGAVRIVIAIALLWYADGGVAALETAASARPIYFSKINEVGYSTHCVFFVNKYFPAISPSRQEKERQSVY